MKKFSVTVTPKYPSSYNSRNEMTIEVRARDKRDANKTARYQLESKGHCFTHDDASTFRAVEVTP